MKVSDLIVGFFEKKSIKVVFGYIGGAITHLVDSLDKSDKVKFVQTYHEQTAAIAAEGYARETQNVGVAMATSGPGATNLITGIADAYFDSIPVIFITGQVNTYEFKYDKPIRQQGFQEMDVVSIVSSITKYAKLVDKEQDIIFELEKAYEIAISGRKGPVLLDIPMNIQRALVDENNLKTYIKEEILEKDKFSFEEIKNLLIESERPLFLIGGGINCLTSEIKKELSEYLIETQIPVISSLMGKGEIQEDKINYLGMVGSYGNRCANMSIKNSDLLIAIGSRLDTRQTGASYEHFLNNGKIIQVDIDNNELIYHRIDDKINVNVDVNIFIPELVKVKKSFNSDNNWIKALNKLKENYNQDKEIERFVENKSPYKLIQKINEISKKNDLFVADIGQNQMWTAQTLKIKENQNFYTSGGLAPMGFSIPFAIGLSFGNRDKRIFSINGDGGFHMSTQGLMLISQYNLSVKVVVINNNALGMITQFQGLYFNNNMVGTTEKGGYIVPKVEGFAKAYSLDYYKVYEKDLSDDKLMDKIFGNNKACIIEYITEGLTTVSPKLEFDSPIYNPSPKLSDEEIDEILKI